MDLIPHAFLFRFAMPIPPASDLPRPGQWPLGNKLPALPLPSRLDRRDVSVNLRVGWNEAGFGVGIDVAGKSEPPFASRDDPAAGDGLHLWIDTRAAQGAHRAGKFCHRFALLPAVGRGKSATPKVMAVEIPRARSAAPDSDLSLVTLAAEVTKTGYRLEVWFPAATLHGYDPAGSPRIGFFALLRDEELGVVPLTVGEEFPVDHDPSLWPTLELTRD